MKITPIHIDDLQKLKTDSVFNSSDWLSIYSNSGINLLGIFNKNEELIGTFYYQKHNRAKVLTHIAPPFLSPNCGLYIVDSTINPAQKNTFYKKVNEALKEHFKDLKSDLFSISFPPNFQDMQSFIWTGYQATPKYTYQIDLNQNEEAILAQMSPERRKNITKSQKEGLVIKESIGDKGSLQLIVNTFVKQGLWHDKLVLNSLFAKFSSSANAISYSCYEGDTLLATVFCIRDNNKAYYILGGFDGESKHSGAGAFAMWHAIKKSKEIGVSIFDFEGSMQPSIEKYFRGFGGKLVPYFSISKQNWKGKLLLKLRKK